MKKFKRLTGIALSACMVLSSVAVPMTAQAYTVDEAVDWINARGNEGWNLDVDGAYGCQCVDLVIAYYRYLLNDPNLIVYANACDYATIDLPSGWTRVYSDPQPGDIFWMGPNVSGSSSFGHVGLIASVSGSSVTTVETNYWTDHYGNPNARFVNRTTGSFSGFIRPNLGPGPIPPHPDHLTSATVPDGKYYIQNVGTGKYLDYSYDWSSTVSSYLKAMITWEFDGSAEQTFVTGDSALLPYADESMDVIMACMAYHHFPEQEKFRHEAWRVLKPGGSLYICDPRFPAPVRWTLNTFFRDAGFRTAGENTKAFEGTGFSTVKIVKDQYVQVLHFEKRTEDDRQ